MSTMRNRNWRAICGMVVCLAAVTVILVRCGAPEAPLSKEVVIREFNRLYYDSHVWARTKWLGVPTEQNPCDLWMIQEVIRKTKPDFIVETGTLAGGSSLFFAMVLAQINENGRVITVDLDPQIGHVSQFQIFKDRVEVIKGDSVSPEVINKIADRVKGHTVLVTLDSDHKKDHVLKELKLYSKFVSTNGYLIVQDTNINGHPVLPNYGPGPMEAVMEFLKENKDFEIDRDQERHLVTHHPSGFLKRVR